MKQGWKSIAFSTAPVQIIDGDRGKNYPKQTDFSDLGYCVFLNTGNVTESGLSFSSVQFISEEKDDVLRKGKLKRNDVVMTTRGTIGNVAHYNEKIPFDHMRINSGMVIFRCDQSQLSPLFLYHFLRSPIFHGQVNALQSGVAQPQLPIRDINRITLALPPIDEQSRIANFISNYDNLIENNRRRIQLLEQSARLLYKEWFVRLRFPGHEHVKIKDGVPEGWQVVPLGDVAKINNESLGKNYQGEIEYIDISSVTPGMINETTYYKFSDSPSRARRIVRHGDIIWSCVRPIRRSHAVIWNPPANLIASTGFAVLTPVSLSTAYLYQVVTTDEFVGYLSNNARGAAYPAVTSSDFESAQILLPKENILDQFKKMVEPLLEQIQSLHQQSIKLAKARDLLLPRLMNGEIEV